MKKAIIKQNKNTSAARVASAALAAFVLLLSLCVNSFAYTDTSTNGVDFSAGSVGFAVDIDAAKAAYSSLPDISFTQGNNVWKPVILSSGQSFDAFCFRINSYFYVAFDSSYYVSSLRMNAVTSSSSFSTKYLSSTNSEYNLNYGGFGSVAYTDTSNIPAFETVEDGLAAVRDWIDNSGGGASVPGHFLGSLAPGYVAYFDVSNLSNVSVRLSTTLYGGTHKYPGFSTSQAIGTSSSLPSGSFSLPITGTSSVNWQGSGQKDLLGRFSQFQYYYTVTSAGGSTYLVVVNPLSRNWSEATTAESSSASNRNNNITIMIDQCRGYKTFSLTESVSILSGALPSASVDSNGSTTSGYIDPDTGAWVGTDDQTGEAVAFSDLPVGGGNMPASAKSVFDFLQEIADSISNFFNGAIGAIGTLVSAGSDFIHSLSGLYAWLPAPVYAVLTSALILVITIGVIKVFI